MQSKVHAAKTNLSGLIDAALAGEAVIVSRGDQPAARLVPMEKSGFKFGGLADLAGTVPDFLEPMPDDDLRLLEGAD
jgi:prevent-host-death family protein